MCHCKKAVCLFVSIFLLGYYPCVIAEADMDMSGHWLTFDDKSGEKRSIVVINEHEGRLSGRIIKVFRKPGDETKCVHCKGEKHNQNIVGLEIFAGLTQDNNVWQGGTILDPENGKEYNCKLWRVGNSIKVRGYISFFYRTQLWEKYHD